MGRQSGDRKGQAMWMQIAKRITGPAAEGKNLLRIAVDAALVAAFVLTSFAVSPLRPPAPIDGIGQIDLLPSALPPYPL